MRFKIRGKQDPRQEEQPDNIWTAMVTKIQIEHLELLKQYFKDKKELGASDIRNDKATPTKNGSYKSSEAEKDKKPTGEL